MKQNIWIIKAGGDLLDQAPIRKQILADIGKLSRQKSVIFVHGGGPQIQAQLERHKIPVRFVKGRRFTSEQGMAIVEKNLSGIINKSLSGQLNAKGIRGVGISCRDGNTVIGKADKNLGRAGHPKRVDTHLLLGLLQNGFVPVLSPVSSDGKGNALNINADDIASAIAVALKAQNLVFLTNVSGVLDGNSKRFPKLNAKSVLLLTKKGVIQGGMIPKTQSALAALKKGVGEVDIVNGKKGIKFAHGTRIVH